MINIPYEFNGSVSFKDYETVKRECRQFETYETIGLDQSGQYEMFMYSLGNSSKPCILICSSIHPPEWQGMYTTLELMKQLKNDTFPDKELRNRLLSDFYIVHVPLVNPYGLNRVLLNKYGIYESGGEGRRNINGVDLNRDFYNFNEQESRNIRALGNRLKPFAVVDQHAYQPDYSSANGKNSVVTGGQQSWGDYHKVTRPITDEWVRSFENYVGESIVSWTNMLSETSGLLRGHFARQSNPFTPYTLSYITEIVRPTYRNRNGVDTLVRRLTDSQMYSYSMAHNYLFLKTSINYYDEYGDDNGGGGGEIPNNEGLVYKIEMPQKTINIVRDSDGVVQSTLEVYKEGYNHPNIKTTLTRDSVGNLIKFNRVKV